MESFKPPNRQRLAPRTPICHNQEDPPLHESTSSVHGDAAASPNGCVHLDCSSCVGGGQVKGHVMGHACAAVLDPKTKRFRERLVQTLLSEPDRTSNIFRVR